MISIWSAGLLSWLSQVSKPGGLTQTFSCIQTVVCQSIFSQDQITIHGHTRIEAKPLKMVSDLTALSVV